MKVSKAAKHPVQQSTITEGQWANGIKVPSGFMATEQAESRQRILLNESVNVNSVFEGEAFSLQSWMIDEVRTETVIKTRIYRVNPDKK